MKRFISSSTIYVGAICIVFSSCVSKRKYQDALNAVHRLQSDSAVWADRGSAYQKNVATLEETNKNLQQQMETARAQSQKEMQGFRNYFDQQKKVAEQLHQQLHQSLDATGLDAQSIHADNGRVYVTLPDNMLFTPGTTKMSTKGREALTKLAEVLKSRNDIEVDIASNASYASYSGSMGTTGQTNVQQHSQAERMDDHAMKNANETGAANETRKAGKESMTNDSMKTDAGKTRARQDRNDVDNMDQSRSEPTGTAKNKNTKAGEKAQSTRGTENSEDLLGSVDQDRASNRKAVEGRAQGRNSENWSNKKMGQSNAGARSNLKSGASTPSMEITKAATIVRLLMDNGVQPIRIVASTAGDENTSSSSAGSMSNNTKGLLIVLTPKTDGLYQLMSSQRNVGSR